VAHQDVAGRGRAALDRAAEPILAAGRARRAVVTVRAVKREQPGDDVADEAVGDGQVVGREAAEDVAVNPGAGAADRPVLT
jgi:hypothetical protein